MTQQAPPLDERKAGQVADQVEKALHGQDWEGREGGAGRALVQLFGRMAELIIHRLNQVPDKHLLSFLNEAGVDLLAPRPAGTDVTLSLAPDGPEVVRVPDGTQVATLQTETQPELIFETQEQVILTPNTLQHCITFDRRDDADRTAQAALLLAPDVRQAEGFPAFAGQFERQRILYLGDGELFGFADAASRQAATVELHLELDVPGAPAVDGWTVEWLYWAGETWAPLAGAGAQVIDGTRHLSQNGSVELAHLPEIVETEIDGQVSRWLAARLAGGAGRDRLPVLRSVRGSRRIEIPAGQSVAIDAAWNSLQANTSFVPLDVSNEFFPLGVRPARLDAFYLACEEAFSKPGATVGLDVAGLEGVPADAASDELAKLTVAWEYYSTAGWTLLGTSTRNKVTPERLGFTDATYAFTQSGAPLQPNPLAPGAVTFTVPAAGGEDPLFARTAVNGREGYWIRARVTAGSYNVIPVVDVKNRLTGTYTFTEGKTYAPLIQKLEVRLGDYVESSPARRLAHCRSQVDRVLRDHAAALARQEPFAPWSAPEEGPGLYLGFARAFPAGEWIQLLLDVKEQFDPAQLLPVVLWEYWNGSVWSLLHVADGTQDLRQRGYLGFYGPPDQRASLEFGHPAFWLRARPHLQPPQAAAGRDQELRLKDAEATVTLDASASQVFGRQHVHRYHWRLVSTRPPVADAGPDQVATTPTVTLDASGSLAAAERPIVRYIWRQAGPEAAPGPGQVQAAAIVAGASMAAAGARALYLKSVRLNTVSALNATTILDEVMGSSDGRPNQVFHLVHSPVLASRSPERGNVEIAVREPDRPSEDEEAELLPSSTGGAGETGVWVRWRRVADFYDSSRHSRHYVLDPATGEVRFGDGERGSVPPVGRDNVKAAFYRAHDGLAGNVARGAIAVVRNPSGDLAEVRSVINHEPAAGGMDAEKVAQVRQRGPHVIKHRGQAVTQEGFEWLSRDADGQVARVFCLPARNPLGLPEPGWVTVVVLPRSGEARPVPAPPLLRQVKKYLAGRALTSLTADENRIHVKGPEYVEATVRARLVPRNPVEADKVKLAVLERLNTFLHPLIGGPQGAGWELGRDVYASEIYAEIESVPGVDYVVYVQVSGSLREQQLRLQASGQGYSRAPYDLPTDSQVSTLDKRLQALLTEPVFEDEPLSTLSVYDFKVGDEVVLVGADNAVMVWDVRVGAVSADSITFGEPFDPPPDVSRWDAAQSANRLLRLPLVEEGVTLDPAGQVVGVKVRGFQVGDRVSIIAYGARDPSLELLPIKEVGSSTDRIFVPAGHLVCPGEHHIEMGVDQDPLE